MVTSKHSGKQWNILPGACPPITLNCGVFFIPMLINTAINAWISSRLKGFHTFDQLCFFWFILIYYKKLPSIFISVFYKDAVKIQVKILWKKVENNLLVQNFVEGSVWVQSTLENWIYGYNSHCHLLILHSIQIYLQNH